MKDKCYDFAIIGAGIAGLATAELLSRSGHKVALIEKNDQVCREASGEHHGWFHFGSLYSIFRSNQFMRTLVGGIDDLLAYYSNFPRMNLFVDDDGKLSLRDGHDVWIRDEPIEYIVTARNDRDFDLGRFESLRRHAEKCFFLLTWEMAIKQFIARHQRFHSFDWRNGPASAWVPRAGWFDYSRQVITKPALDEINLDPDTHFRIVGFDRPMNTQIIIADLLHAFLMQGGDLLTKTAYLGHIRRGGTFEVTTNLGTIRCKNLLLACGRFFKHLLPKLKATVVASPILVAYPALCDRNFVRLTPFMDRTINHLIHSVDGEKYSVVGGGYYADPEDDDAVAAAKTALVNMAQAVFPRLQAAALCDVYVGYKTELISEAGERNYQYHIRPLDENVWALVPGKFSLGFSLAVNCYKRILGTNPAESARMSLGAVPDVSSFIGPMYHGELVTRHLLAARRASYGK